MSHEGSLCGSLAVLRVGILLDPSALARVVPLFTDAEFLEYYT